MRRASPNAGRPASLPFGRYAQRMNLASSMVMTRALPSRPGTEAPWTTGVSARSNAARSWAFPRDRRDITVPMGTSSVSAISW